VVGTAVAAAAAAAGVGRSSGGKEENQCMETAMRVIEDIQDLVMAE